MYCNISNMNEQNPVSEDRDIMFYLIYEIAMTRTTTCSTVTSCVTKLPAIYSCVIF